MNAQQLKNSILQIAVQGKLVPQDPNDEPASVLLERIRKEKEKLIKEGKIKKEKNPSYIFRGEDNLPYEKVGKNEPVCIADEVPFEIPDSWEWVRLADLVSIYTGKKDANFGDPQGKYDFFTCSNEPIKSPSYSYDGEYLIMPGNGANIGLVIYYCGQFEAYQRTYLLQNVNSINLHYLKYHLEYNWKQYNSDKMYGSAIPYIKLGNLQEYLVAFPPLGEQTRIVEEIEKLIPYVEKYDETESEVSVLNSSFPELLRKSILQQAVMGKLVPQDPNDEPASVLLERIRAEKQELIKAGKLKKDKHESIIYRRDNFYYEKLNGVERCIDNEIPFEIPDTWEWVRLGSIFQHNTGKALNSSNREGKSLTYITTSNLYWNRFELDNLRQMFFTESEIDKCTVTKGDLLVCEGGDIGRAAIWMYDCDIRIQNHIHRLRAYSSVCTDYFYYLFFLYKNAGIIGGKGIGIQGLSSNALHNIMFPLPPLNEQYRIVTKIEELFIYSDKLMA